MELHRNSLGEDYIPQISSSKVTHRAASPMLDASQSYGRSSSHNSHDPSVDKGIHTITFFLLNMAMKKYIHILAIKLFRIVFTQTILDQASVVSWSLLN